MKKWRASFFLFSILGLVIAGCSTNSEQLSRIDVQEVNINGGYAGEVIITDKDTIESVETIFKQVKWDRNTIPSMARIEDVKATFFYEIDENMPETLTEYRIWFNEENGTATIISSDENESYGELDETNRKVLEKELVK